MTSSSLQSAAPIVDDPAHALSQSLAGPEPSDPPRLSRQGWLLAAGLLAVVAAAMLMRTALDLRDIRTEGVVMSMATSVSSLLGAGAAYRMRRDRSLGLALGVTAYGFAAVAGVLVVPGGVGAPNALLAAVASVASAVVMRAIGCHATVFTALACGALAAVAAALMCSVTAVPLPALCAAAAAIALIVIELSGPIAITLAGLSPQRNVEHVRTRALDARIWLTSLVTAFSCIAALAAVGLSLTAGPHSIVFCALTGGVLLSRAYAHRHLPIFLALSVFGTVSVSSALLGAASVYPMYTAQLAVASIGMAAAALWLGSGTHWTTVSFLGRRGVEVLERLALAAVLPLACWMCGLYDVVRHLDLL